MKINARRAGAAAAVSAALVAGSAVPAFAAYPPKKAHRTITVHKGGATITVTGAKGTIFFLVYDRHGHQVEFQKGSATSFSFSNLPKGKYVVVVHSEGFTKFGHFIVK
jgi:hypothetical protein